MCGRRLTMTTITAMIDLHYAYILLKPDLQNRITDKGYTDTITGLDGQCSRALIDNPLQQVQTLIFRYNQNDENVKWPES